MMNVLEATNVRKLYGKDKIALDNASLTLKNGEILGLLGPNGAGKTTLIKIMATLLNKDAGQISVLGYDIDTHEEQIRHLLGYVGQDTERSMYARLNPRENLRFFGRLRGLSKDWIDERIGSYTQAFGFEEEILEKQFMHLSGGQKQSVVIMRALLHDPPVIFLDEPTKGLDPFAANNIRSFLKEFVQSANKSLILTSHILHEVDYLADRCALINKGKIPIIDTPKALKSSVGATEFIELEAKHLPAATLQRIQTLDEVIAFNMKESKDDEWASFGVVDLFDGTEAILDVLKQDAVRTGFRQRSISLEDAFIHHIGAFRDEAKA